jgi:hypothetical protein
LELDWNSTGTFRPKEGFSQDRELAMHAIVDKVLRAFAAKSPVADHEAKLAHQEAAEFAAELLDNYKHHLARRTSRANSH